MTFWEEQMAHEQTRKYYEKLKEIIYSITDVHALKIIDGKYKEVMLGVLEIGLDVGISARCFLEFHNINLTSVDSGDVDGGIKNIKALDVGDRWTFHPMKSDDFFDQNKKEFDIIYIDGLHTYGQVKRDANNAWKFLKPGGVLIGHDVIHKSNYTNDSDCGVSQAFAEFIDENNVGRISIRPIQD